MNANELRIGDIAYRTNKLTKEKLTIELTASCILDISANGEMSSFIYEPIPLTEEWFIKFGFEVTVNNNHYLEHGSIEIGRMSSKRFYIQIRSENTTLDIKYVHQLQNLYFALTGQELTPQD